MEYPDSIPFRFPRQFILEGIKIILNNNTFFDMFEEVDRPG